MEDMVFPAMKQTLGIAIAKKGRTVWQQASVLKLHRGYILTKKGDIKPKKNLENPPGPLGGVFRFKKRRIV